METYEIASMVMLISVGLGIFLSIGLNDTNNHNSGTEQVHEHALFHVVINGSEVDFADQKFQLQAGRVHLENNKSDIVHKHQAGVKWSGFLKTINTTYWRSNSTGNLCVDIYNEVTCGDGAVYLNGEKINDTDVEISQGDHLVIVLDTENRTKLMQEYMKQQLPQDYKPQSVRGKRV